MSDQCEEQEMEAEALTAIFDDCFEIVSASQPFEWAISIWPEQHSPEENHVGIKLLAKIPLDYPEVSLPTFSIDILKGLANEHQEELLEIAKEEAEANLGLPSIFAVCERLREWLAENNVKGMDDVSMYAQMLRREKEKEKETVRLERAGETHWIGSLLFCRHTLQTMVFMFWGILDGEYPLSSFAILIIWCGQDPTRC